MSFVRGAFKPSFVRLDYLKALKDAGFSKPLLAFAATPRTKISTQITGLHVHPAPLPYLINTYTSTLEKLKSIPETSVYRQSVEVITKERLSAVEELGGTGSDEDIKAVEDRIDAGLIEEVLDQAEEEFALLSEIESEKFWEDLEEKPEPEQWVQHKSTASTTTADDLHI